MRLLFRSRVLIRCRSHRSAGERVPVEDDAVPCVERVGRVLCGHRAVPDGVGEGSHPDHAGVCIDPARGRAQDLQGGVILRVSIVFLLACGVMSEDLVL